MEMSEYRRIEVVQPWMTTQSKRLDRLACMVAMILNAPDGKFYVFHEHIDWYNKAHVQDDYRQASFTEDFAIYSYYWFLKGETDEGEVKFYLTVGDLSLLASLVPEFPNRVEQYLTLLEIK